MGGLPGSSPSTSCKHRGLTQSIVPAGTSFGKAGVYPARKPPSASPFAAQLAGNSFSVRLDGVSPSRPEPRKAPRGAAVNAGRRPPPQAARSGVEGREHGAIVDEAGPLTPL